MININLRNWREERRKEKTKSYLEINVFIGILIVLALVLTNLVASKIIENQKQINNYLKSEQKDLNTKLTEIGELENQIRAINSRMEIINDLQKNRSNAIIILDEIAKKTPKEIKLRKLKRENGFLAIEGISVSQLNISTYLRNLDDSKYFSNTRLEQVIADEKVDGFERSRFFIKTQDKTKE